MELPPLTRRRPIRSRRGLLLTLAGLSLFFLSSSATSAKDPIQLFTPDPRGPSWVSPVPGYNELVEKIQPGDVLRFSDGKQLTVTGVLGAGAGNTARVYSVLEEPGRVLRISKDTSVLYDAGRYLKAFPQLWKGGVPMVNVDPRSNLEWTLVDQLDPSSVKLRGLFSGEVKDPALKAEMTSSLREFVRATAGFKQIGDLRPDQLAYDPKRGKWLLFDWDQNNFGAFQEVPGKPPVLAEDSILQHLFQENVSIRPFGASTVQNPKDRWILDLYNEMEKIVREERQKFLRNPKGLDLFKVEWGCAPKFRNL